MNDITLHTVVTGHIVGSEPAKDTAHGKRQKIHVKIDGADDPRFIGKIMPSVLWRELADADLPSVQPTKAERDAGAVARFEFTVNPSGTWNNITNAQRIDA